MKKVLSKGIVMVMAALFVSVFSINTSKAQGSVSMQVFYDELQPYGTWMQHASYGYVWMPRVDRGFTPYATNGYWINTEYGNTWVSDYSWGWAPFHYGRWFYDDFHGWIWVPDTEWAPAWVAWRSGGGYYGWAPLMPGFGINVSFSYYNRLPNYYWNFVPYRYVTYRTVYRHCVPRPHVVNIINNTTIITNNYTDNRRRTYFTGPTRNEMERTGRTRVDVYKVNDRSRPGRTEIDRGSVSFYKPDMDNSRDTKTRPMPSRYMRTDKNGGREMVELRTPRTEASVERRLDNTLPRETERSPRRSDFDNNSPAKRQSMQQNLPDQRREQNDVFERFDRERENMDRDQQNYNQRREQLEKQSTQGSNRPDQNLRQQQGNNIKRSNEFPAQKSEQLQRQGSPRQTERPDQNLRQQRESDVRTNPNQSQRMQQMERQTPSRSRQVEQPNQNIQRQRSSEKPVINRSSTQQRQPQIQRSTPQQRSNQPARSVGGEPSTRKRK